MKPEIEKRIKSRIAEREVWLRSKHVAPFEKVAEILAKRPFPEGLQDQSQELRRCCDFIYKCPRILKEIKKAQKKPPPFKSSSRVLKGLLSYIKKAKEETLLQELEMVDSWIRVRMEPDQELADLLSELEARVLAITEDRSDRKGSGRRAEIWQCLLVERLERDYSRIFGEVPSKDVNSPFTKLVKVFLRELTGGVGYEEANIVKDLFPKCEKYDSPL